eukprot:TRINITY_DN2176_c0_g1_i1.p1 TRINITY_DN2176_c0_g1~~TRINITY_DN2176_c0_g1_i1.p1  ORF type:complete len:508 (-),score=49.24 TRINITY_DN2176_c0_g1_i1:202-1725(-)
MEAIATIVGNNNSNNQIITNIIYNINVVHPDASKEVLFRSKNEQTGKEIKEAVSKLLNSSPSKISLFDEKGKTKFLSPNKLPPGEVDIYEPKERLKSFSIDANGNPARAVTLDTCIIIEMEHSAVIRTIISSRIFSLDIPPISVEAKLPKFLSTRISGEVKNLDELSKKLMEIVKARISLSLREQPNARLKRILEILCEKNSSNDFKLLVYAAKRSLDVWSNNMVFMTEIPELMSDVFKAHKLRVPSIYSTEMLMGIPEIRAYFSKIQVDRICSNCFGAHGKSHQCPSLSNPRPDVFCCWRCNGEGHALSNCPSINANITECCFDEMPSPPRCYYCLQFRKHVKAFNDCPTQALFSFFERFSDGQARYRLKLGAKELVRPITAPGRTQRSHSDPTAALFQHELPIQRPRTASEGSSTLSRALSADSPAFVPSPPSAMPPHFALPPPHFALSPPHFALPPPFALPLPQFSPQPHPYGYPIFAPNWPVYIPFEMVQELPPPFTPPYSAQ